MDRPSYQTVKEKDNEINTKIGDLSTLSTTEKTNLVGAMNEVFQSVSNGKSAVASAITDKGVQTQADATFAQMATNISAIETGITPPTTYRGGTFTLSTAVNAATKVATLDADVISHKDDANFVVAIFPRNAVTTSQAFAGLRGNRAFNGTRYGYGFYQSSSSMSSQVHTVAVNAVQSNTIAGFYVLSDGLYIVGSSSYKWAAGEYNYLISW